MWKATERIEDCGEMQTDFLVRVKDLMIQQCQKLAQDILHYQEWQRHPERQCPACVIALYLMAIKSLVDDNKELHADQESVKASFRDAYKMMIDALNQWIPEKSSQTENDLWIFAVIREIGDCFSLNGYENGLSDCLRVLEQRKSYVICLMLWLFPKFAIEDRVKLVENMAMGNRAWLWRDKMLFWIACIKNRCYDQIKMRSIEAQVRNLQLGSGAFATVEGKEEKGDLISSAIGLLVLVSCAKRDGLESVVVDAVLKTARWIEMSLNATQNVDESCRAWALYALSEYLTLVK